ncbi:hypothetical protein [Pseudomonas sp. LS-2]|uniref:hypothetical protein n=1 Tax=Pseudomonas sp. LS-2 TaxID=2315859 RepID=UPI000E76582E|nr:hypothetical protein [Pseudomonas sp. LS-2]RJX80313.1 hypothetical protein D3M70_12245 [Pseudomonas sp. LS-2]
MSTIKSFRTDARGGGDLDNMPNIVTFAVDENLAREIASLAEFVASHGLHKVEKFDGRAQFLRHDPMIDPDQALVLGDENHVRTECGCLAVSGSEFWFTAFVKHTDEEVSSPRQSIKELILHFMQEESAPAMVTCANCTAEVEEVIGCPDGSEVCNPCFESGSR